MANTKTAAKPRKKSLRKVHEGIAHVQANFNNTIITVTTMSGDVLTWATGGVAGYKGSRKGGPFAAQLAVEKIAQVIKGLDMKHIEIRVSGPGLGRDSAIRTFHANGFMITRIVDVTRLPFNGCKPSKRRRT